MTDDLRADSLPGCDYVIWQNPQQFCFTTDAVFLAAFPHLVTQARVLELGCGTGAISLLLAARGAQTVLGVDINPQVVELLHKSIQTNKLEAQVQATLGDIRQYKQLVASEAFDLVVANPPYRLGGKRRVIGRAACHEEDVTLEDFFAAAAYAVKYRGRFALVQLPERFAEAVELGNKYGLQIKRLQWVHAFIHKPAWIFLAEFVKGGKAGLEVLPPLVMYKQDGSYSAATLAYYNRPREGEDHDAS